jgi:nucleotide-binding universal stress UspA family protein
MNPFRRILIAVGNAPTHESVVAQAARLAEQHGASVTLVSVVEDLPWYARLVLPSAQELQELVLQHRADLLERLSETFRARGIETTTRVLQGRAPVAVIREMLQHRHDLVIKEAIPNANVPFGSTDMQLLRNSPGAVLLVKPESAAEPFRRIAAAVDPAPADDGAELSQTLGLRVEFDDKDPALDRKIIEMATSFASGTGELHIVHAWSAPGEWMLRGEVLLTQEQVDRYVDDVRAEARKAMEKLLESMPSESGRRSLHLLEGDPADCITEFATREQIDLVVMGTVARSGLSALLMGNTAEMILQRVGCSVLAVKPEGFVSPVTLEVG